MNEVTLCLSYYRNCEMLMRQVQEWEHYPDGIKIIVVDDGSPEPALPIIESTASPDLLERIALYRIMVDVPWNREEARNLAAMQCDTEMLMNLDIDHLLPAESARALLEFSPNKKHWYRFPRWRKGKADETRRKDSIADDIEFGEIKPHIDGYLISKDLYMKSNGYDLAFSGCLGGGSDYLKRLEAIAKPLVLPAQMPLHVYTRSEVKDASDWSLSRDTNEGKRRSRVKQLVGKPIEKCAVKSPWERQL
jgi:hypothetical protein